MEKFSEENPPKKESSSGRGEGGKNPPNFLDSFEEKREREREIK